MLTGCVHFFLSQNFEIIGTVGTVQANQFLLKGSQSYVKYTEWSALFTCYLRAVSLRFSGPRL